MNAALMNTRRRARTIIHTRGLENLGRGSLPESSWQERGHRCGRGNCYNAARDVQTTRLLALPAENRNPPAARALHVHIYTHTRVHLPQLRSGP